MDRRLRSYFAAGVAGIALGLMILIVGVLAAHYTAIDELDQFGREAWTWVPRSWQIELAAQIVALTGVLIAMAGATLAFLYQREMTWARASLGAALFTGLMLVLFAVIPNQWLSLTQGVWEWTPQKKAITWIGDSSGGLQLIPKPLVLNNEISLSMSALKDIVSGTYSVVVLGAVAVGMYQWQERSKKLAAAPKQLVSTYGRPMSKVEG